MILGTEVNEFVTNRQQSKIYFLLQENNQLQEYIQDLENALRLNKQVMKITLDNFTTSRNKSLPQSSLAEIPQSQSKQQLDKYELLLQHLNEENSNLVETLSKTQKTTTTTSTKALLQEQIAQENQNFYKDIIQDLEDKLIELKRNIHDKEYAIQELERIKPLLEKEGQIVKIIEIVTPSESTLKMHEELENIRQVLNKITSEAQIVSQQNKTLREVNYNLKREVYKLRIVLRSQVAHHIMKDFVYNEYIERTDQNMELNYEIQSHRGKLEQLHQDMFGQGSLGYGFSPEPQQLKYLSKNERMIYQEKLHKMETMLKGFRELFEKEKFINQQTVIKYNDLIQQGENLNDTNELLIKSNVMKDDRIKKMQVEQQFLKKQLNQYMEIIKTRRHNYNQSVHLQQEQDIAVNLFSPKQSIKFNSISPKKNLFQAQKPFLSIDYDKIDEGPQTERRVTDRKSSNIVESRGPVHDVTYLNQKLSKKPILQALIIDDPSDKANENKNFCYTSRDVGSRKKPEVGNLYYDMNLIECKQFLVSMALEFNKTYDIQSSNSQKISLMNQIADVPKELRRVQRSNSDPFGYFSKEMEEDVVAFKRPPKVSALNFIKSEIHVILEEIQQKKFTRQVKDEQVNPFNLDVSQIQDNKQQQQQQEPQSFRNKKKNVFVDAELSFISKNNDDDDDDNSEQEQYISDQDN